MNRELVSECSGKGAILQGEEALLTIHVEAQNAQLMCVDENKHVIDSVGNEGLAFREATTARLWAQNLLGCTHGGPQKQLLGWHLQVGAKKEEINERGHRRRI